MQSSRNANDSLPLRALRFASVSASFANIPDDRWFATSAILVCYFFNAQRRYFSVNVLYSNVIPVLQPYSMTEYFFTEIEDWSSWYPGKKIQPQNKQMEKEINQNKITKRKWRLFFCKIFNIRENLIKRHENKFWFTVKILESIKKMIRIVRMLGFRYGFKFHHVWVVRLLRNIILAIRPKSASTLRKKPPVDPNNESGIGYTNYSRSLRMLCEQKFIGTQGWNVLAFFKLLIKPGYALL